MQEGEIVGTYDSGTQVIELGKKPGLFQMKIHVTVDQGIISDFLFLLHLELLGGGFVIRSIVFAMIMYIGP
jgi:hypothetical protein